MYLKSNNSELFMKIGEMVLIPAPCKIEDKMIISIPENSRKPKYVQVVDSITNNISIGNFVMDDKIPSINMLSEELYLSRDTVEKAYKILKERKLINSVRRKGFYIARTDLKK